MEIKLTREDVEYAIRVHIFAKTGMRLDDTRTNVIIDSNNDYYAVQMKGAA